MAGSPGAWRAPVHPRFRYRPALDWPAAEALARAADSPWAQVAPLLAAIEAGARAGAASLPEEEEA